jgi:hypothetical protein
MGAMPKVGIRKVASAAVRRPSLYATRVRARVDVSGHGLGGDALAGAAVTLLRGGAPDGVKSFSATPASGAARKDLTPELAPVPALALHRALRTVKREVEQAGT